MQVLQVPHSTASKVTIYHRSRLTTHFLFHNGTVAPALEIDCWSLWFPRIHIHSPTSVTRNFFWSSEQIFALKRDNLSCFNLIQHYLIFPSLGSPHSQFLLSLMLIRSKATRFVTAREVIAFAIASRNRTPLSQNIVDPKMVILLHLDSVRALQLVKFVQANLI